MDIENAQPLFEEYIKPYEAEIELLKTKLDEHDLCTKLIDAWIAENGKQISWGKAIEIVAIVTKMPANERSKLLTMDEPNIQLELEMLRGALAQAQAEKAELVRRCAEIVFNHAETVNLGTGERTLTKRTIGDLNGIAYGNEILSLLPKE